MFLLLLATRAWPALALTAAGTVISETATASYTDALSNNYNATGNTVTTTVQNSPSLTITDPSPENVTPADLEIDTFTFTNTGNGSGSFALTADATFGGTATGTTLKGYVLNGASSGTCSTASLCTTYSALNAAITSTAANGAITVGVEFQVSSSAASAQTIQPSITANIAYAAGTGTSAVTSSNVTNTTYSDTVTTDARLDVQAAATTPGSSGANITWTITANNGGGYAAADLQSVKAVLGSAANGIAIFIPVPSFSGTALTLQAQPSAPTLSGATSGATAARYYNATACSSSPTTGWSTTYSASAKCLAILLSGGSGGVELPSATGGSSGAGSVTTAQITFSFTTNQPSGSGSGNANSVTLIASSAIGGNAWETGAIPILGQGVTMGTADAATASLIAGIESNATSSSGTTPPGGASNQAGSKAYATYGVALGSGAAVETGAWSAGTVPGYTSGTADTNHDFTFVGLATSSAAVNSATNPAGAPSGNTLTTFTSTVIPIGSNLENTGIINDTYTLSNTSISGWTVTYYQADCATALVSNQIAVNAGSTVGVCAKFAAPTTVTAYTPYDFTITATSVGSGSISNQVHDVLYPGGAIVTFKSYAVSGCPGGVTPANNGVISGCTITVTVTVVNEAPVTTAGGGSSTNTTFTGSNIVVTQNAAATGNTWGGSTTNGISAAPNLTSCSSCTTTGTTGSTNFTVTIPSLAAQAAAIFTYALVVK